MTTYEFTPEQQAVLCASADAYSTEVHENSDQAVDKLPHSIPEHVRRHFLGGPAITAEDGVQE